MFPVVFTERVSRQDSRGLLGDVREPHRGLCLTRESFPVDNRIDKEERVESRRGSRRSGVWDGGLTFLSTFDYGSDVS